MFNPNFVDVMGKKTRYFEVGKGEPLVLIHGGHYGSYYSADCWGLNMNGLATDHRVIALDKLGMGYTDNPSQDSDYTMDATIEHAYQFLLAMGIERVTLVGHSRGALPAAYLAIQHPDLVTSIVIADTNTLAPSDSSIQSSFYTNIEKATPPVPTRESVLLEPELNAYSRNHITPDFAEALYQIAMLPKTVEAKKNMARTESSVFYPQLSSRKGETLELIEGGHLKVPTLILWGLNDPSAPFELGTSLFHIMASKNERTQFHALNHAGHYSFRDQPDDFNRVVTTFLQA